MKKIELTDEGKRYMEAIFQDTIEDTQEYFPNISKQDLIFALNKIAESNGSECDFVEGFVEGMKHQRRKSRQY